MQATGVAGQAVSGRAIKRDRQRVMRDTVTRQSVRSQQEFVQLLSEHGFDVTQATVSRDISELGLVKVVRAGRHVYALPEDIASPPRGNDEALRRVLRDLPISVGRSGLILLLVSGAGTAQAIAEAIDRSSLLEQEGTLAGDNTVLVLFRDEQRLERWLARLAQLNGEPLPPTRP